MDGVGGLTTRYVSSESVKIIPGRAEQDHPVRPYRDLEMPPVDDLVATVPIARTIGPTISRSSATLCDIDVCQDHL